MSGVVKKEKGNGSLRPTQHVLNGLLLFFFWVKFWYSKEISSNFPGSKKAHVPKKITYQSKKILLILAWHHNNYHSIHSLSFSTNSHSFSKNHCEISFIFYFSFTSLLNSYNFNFVASLFFLSSPLPFRFSQLSLHQNHNGPFDHQRNLLFLFHPTM